MSGLTDMGLRAQLIGGVKADRIDSTQRGMRIHFTPRGQVPLKNTNSDLRYRSRNERPSAPCPPEWRRKRRPR